MLENLALRHSSPSFTGGRLIRRSPPSTEPSGPAFPKSGPVGAAHSSSSSPRHSSSGTGRGFVFSATGGRYGRWDAHEKTRAASASYPQGLAATTLGPRAGP